MIAETRRLTIPINKAKTTNLPMFARTFLALLIPAAPAPHPDYSLRLAPRARTLSCNKNQSCGLIDLAPAGSPDSAVAEQTAEQERLIGRRAAGFADGGDANADGDEGEGERELVLGGHGEGFSLIELPRRAYAHPP
jgi:hypothetical protein